MKPWMIRILAAVVFLGYLIYFYMKYTDNITGKAASNIGGALSLAAIIVVIIHAKWGGGWKGNSDE